MEVEENRADRPPTEESNRLMLIRHWLQPLRVSFPSVIRNPEVPFLRRRHPGFSHRGNFRYGSPKLQFHRHAMARRIAARQSHWTARQRLG